MPTPLELTQGLYLRRRAISNRATAAGLQLWRSINPNELDQGWLRVGRTIALLTTEAQLASATLSTEFVDGVIAETSFKPLVGRTDPRQYAGVAPDGRGLTALLYGAVTETKRATGAGWQVDNAFQSGAAFLATVMKSAIADVARQHDQVYMNAKGVKRYIRTISPGACSRCAILAGTFSSSVAFQRHPNCQCLAVPLPGGKVPPGLQNYSSPADYFNSLSPAEQDRIFTVAGARAIRDGADIAQVVNARRGAYYTRTSSVAPNRLSRIQIGTRADGSPLYVYATTEGTTRRGQFSRLEQRRLAANPNYRTTTLRLMPEQIYLMAGNNPDRARELLIRYGYIW